MVEAGKLGEGCVSWLDVEDLLTISFLLGLGDRLGWDFAEGKKKQEHCSCRFFFSFEMQATYLVSCGRLETFPRCWVQPATPQLLFLWENIKRQMRVSFIVRKTAWDTNKWTHLHYQPSFCSFLDYKYQHAVRASRHHANVLLLWCILLMSFSIPIPLFKSLYASLNLSFPLPSPEASIFRAAKAFRVTWSKRSELTERDWENAVQGLGNVFSVRKASFDRTFIVSV